MTCLPKSIVNKEVLNLIQKGKVTLTQRVIAVKKNLMTGHKYCHIWSTKRIFLTFFSEHELAIISSCIMLNSLIAKIRVQIFDCYFEFRRLAGNHQNFVMVLKASYHQLLSE